MKFSWLSNLADIIISAGVVLGAAFGVAKYKFPTKEELKGVQKEFKERKDSCQRMMIEKIDKQGEALKAFSNKHDADMQIITKFVGRVERVIEEIDRGMS